MNEELIKTIKKLELALLTPEVRSSIEELDKLLADDFIEFGSSGFIYTKKDILERLPTSSGKVEYVVSNFKIQELSSDVVLATFKTDRTINDTDKIYALRSSLWRKVGNNWQMFFHQGTPIS